MSSFIIWVFSVLFFALLSLESGHAARKAVTHTGGSRLGDKLVDYAHAKWVSYKWGMPLFYTPFEHSDELVLDMVEKKISPKRLEIFKNVILKSVDQLDEEVQEDTLYFVEHFPDSYDEFKFIGWPFSPYIFVDWEDPAFKSMMKKLIAPKAALKLIEPPKGTITVAIHFRTGFGYDRDNIKKILPLRFPPADYYSNQLSLLLSLVNHAPLYVHIFTDHPKPIRIKKFFEGKFPKENISFNVRRQDNRHDLNVLEDLFSMLKFDCMIRPISHYSSIASHIGDHKILICPKNGHWEGDRFFVDEVTVKERAKWDTLQKKWYPIQSNMQ